MFRYSFLIPLSIVFLVGCLPASSPESTAQTSPARPTCVPTPTPDMSTRTPTPTFPAPGTPWPTPKPGTPNFVTPTPIPFAKVTDLAPDLPDSQKTRFIVYRCNGSYELFWGRLLENTQGITETLKLEPGDILLYAVPPPSYLPRKVVPPPPPTIRIEGITLEEARQNFGFHLLEPTYLPKGFRLRYVTHVGVIPGDQIDLDYAGPPPAGTATSQSFVEIIERFSPPEPTPPGGIPPAPTSATESVRIRGTRALIDRRFSPPAWFTPEPPSQLYIALEWSENNLMLTVGGSVRLEELIKIAESMK